jgi:cell filamentation protein
MFFAEINRVHPFREGNGRAQRQFVRRLSSSVGYKLHFEVVSKERLVQAGILSANGDIAMMTRLSGTASLPSTSTRVQITEPSMRRS